MEKQHCIFSYFQKKKHLQNPHYRGSEKAKADAKHSTPAWKAAKSKSTFAGATVFPMPKPKMMPQFIVKGEKKEKEEEEEQEEEKKEEDTGRGQKRTHHHDDDDNDDDAEGNDGASNLAGVEPEDSEELGCGA